MSASDPGTVEAARGECGSCRVLDSRDYACDEHREYPCGICGCRYSMHTATDCIQCSLDHRPEDAHHGFKFWLAILPPAPTVSEEARCVVCGDGGAEHPRPGLVRFEWAETARPQGWWYYRDSVTLAPPSLLLRNHEFTSVPAPAPSEETAELDELWDYYGDGLDQAEIRAEIEAAIRADERARIESERDV